MARRRRILPHRFQFPSNGKALSDSNFRRPSSARDERFNSLQTGKPFRTFFFRLPSGWGWPLIVSIPFKRESPFGLQNNPADRERQPKFQFPSNGKALSDRSNDNSKGLCPGGNSFNSLQTGKPFRTAPNFSPVQPWLRRPKTKRELRGAFFRQKFYPKFRQTLVNIEPNAIFLRNWL